MKQKLLKQYTIYLIAGASVLFAFLIYLVYYHPISHLDVVISRDFQSEGDTFFSKSILYNLFRAVSFIGVPTVAAILVISSALLYWLSKLYRESVYILATAIATPVDYMIKEIIHRPRPSDTIVNVIDQQSSPSFPSGHVVFFTVFFGYIIVSMIINKKIRLWLRFFIVLISLMLIILISFSRVYMGAHWLSDVLGGYLLGFIILCMISYFYLRPLLHKEDNS